MSIRSCVRECVMGGKMRVELENNAPAGFSRYVPIGLDTHNFVSASHVSILILHIDVSVSVCVFC